MSLYRYQIIKKNNNIINYFNEIKKNSIDLMKFTFAKIMENPTYLFSENIKNDIINHTTLIKNNFKNLINLNIIQEEINNINPKVPFKYIITIKFTETTFKFIDLQLGNFNNNSGGILDDGSTSLTTLYNDIKDDIKKIDKIINLLIEINNKI